MYHTLAPLDVQLARFMRMTDYTRHDIRGFHNLTFGTNFACWGFHQVFVNNASRKGRCTILTTPKIKKKLYDYLR